MKKIYSLVSIIAISLFSATVANAQTEGATQTAVSMLNVSPDAHTMGLAGAGVTMYSTSYSIWNNIAATALSEDRLSVGVNYGMWGPGAANTNLIAAAGYGRLSKMFTISAGVRSYVYSPYNITDNAGNISGQFTPYDVQASVGLGIRVLKFFSLGVNVNYVTSHIGGPQSANAFSADVAALFDFKFLKVGATASNLGSGINYGGPVSYQLPANVKVGLGTTQRFGTEDKHAVTASLQGGALVYTGDIFGELGVEYMFKNFFRVSAGYHYGANDSLYSIPSYASVGLGINIKGLAINAAYLIGTSANSGLGNTFNLGVSFSL